MKNSVLVVSVLLLGLSTGCQKNDDRASMEIALQNEPPLSFDLVDVPDDATDVDLSPIMTWESAENPKGSPVTYDLYLGTEVNPSTMFESGINVTSFEITDRLHLITNYYWKVVAKDFEGKTAQSPVQKFTTRNINFPNEPVTASAGFLERTGHTSVVFDSKLWVIGRQADLEAISNEAQNDVWYSEDGSNWILATAEASFSERSGHTSVVFDNKIWVIGGYEQNDIGAGKRAALTKRPVGFKNDVWFSEDGSNWIAATAAAGFSKRLGHTSVVFDNKIWVIGGSGADGPVNDVWFSSDGINWSEATSSASFSSRFRHASLTFDNKIWVIGGKSGGFESTPKNDVWYSSDGTNWNSSTMSAEFSERWGHTATVFDDIIWIIGGAGKSDVWHSHNGSKWELTNTNFLERQSHITTVFKDKIWLIGGQANGVKKNDVWSLD